MSAGVASIHERKGRIAGSYSTRAQERVWIVDWDDGKLRPPIDLDFADDLAVGARVRVVGGRLERIR